MERSQWSKIIVRWVNCLKIPNIKIKNVRNLLDFKVFFHLLIYLDNIDDKSDENKDYHKISVLQFINKEYPHFNNNRAINQLNEEEAVIVALLLLHYSCMKSKDGSIRGVMCQRLSPIDQKAIMNFANCLLKCNSITEGILKDAMTISLQSLESEELDSNLCSPQTWVMPLTSPSPLVATPPSGNRSRRSNRLKHLEAALEAERFDRSYLQEELRRQTLKIEELEKQQTIHTSEVVHLRSELARWEREEDQHEGEEDEGKGAGLGEGDRRLRAEVAQLEKDLLTCMGQAAEVNEERDIGKKKILEMESELLIWRDRAMESHSARENLQNRVEDLNNEIVSLKTALTEATKILEEYRSENPNMNTSIECDDDTFSRKNLNNSFSGPIENLGKAVIDVQLKEQINQNNALADQLVENVARVKELAEKVINMQEVIDAYALNITVSESKLAEAESIIKGKEDVENLLDICKVSLEVSEDNFKQKVEDMNKQIQINVSLHDKIHILEIDADTHRKELELSKHTLNTLFEEKEKILQIKCNLIVELKDYEMKLNNEKDCIENLQLQMNKNNDVIQNYEQQIKILILEKNNLCNEIASIQFSLDKSNKNMDEKVDEIFNLKESIAFLEKEMHILNISIETLQEQSDTQKVSIDELTRDNEGLVRLKAQMEDQLRVCEGNLTSQSNQIEQSKNYVNNYKNEIDNNRLTILTLHSENENFAKFNQNISQELEIIKSDKELRIQDLERLTLQKKSLEEKIVSLEIDITNYHKEVLTKNQIIDTVMIDNTKLHESILSSEKELSNLEEKLSKECLNSGEMNIEILSLTIMNNDLTYNFTTLSEANSIAVKVNADLNIELTSLISEVNKKQLKVTALLDSKSILDAEVSNLKRKIETAEADISMKDQSLSSLSQERLILLTKYENNKVFLQESEEKIISYCQQIDEYKEKMQYLTDDNKRLLENNVKQANELNKQQLIIDTIVLELNSTKQDLDLKSEELDKNLLLMNKLEIEIDESKKNITDYLIDIDLKVKMKDKLEHEKSELYSKSLHAREQLECCEKELSSERSHIEVLKSRLSETNKRCSDLEKNNYAQYECIQKEMAATLKEVNSLYAEVQLTVTQLENEIDREPQSQTQKLDIFDTSFLNKVPEERCESTKSNDCIIRNFNELKEKLESSHGKISQLKLKVTSYCKKFESINDAKTVLVEENINFQNIKVSMEQELETFKKSEQMKINNIQNHLETIAFLENEIEKMKLEISENCEKIRSNHCFLETSETGKEKNIEMSQNKIDSYENELLNVHKDNKTLQQNLTANKDEVVQLTEEIIKFIQKTKDLQNYSHKVEAELSDLKQNETNRVLNFNKILQKKITLKKDVNDLKTDLLLLKNEINEKDLQLNDAYTKIADVIISLSSKVHLYEQELFLKNEQVDTLTKSISKCNKEIDLFKKQISEILEKNKELQSSLLSITEGGKVKTEENISLLQEKEALESKIYKSESEILKYQEELASLEILANSLNLEKVGLLKESELIKSQRKSLEDSLSSKCCSIEISEKQIDKYYLDITDYKNKCAELVNENTKMRMLIDSSQLELLNIRKVMHSKIVEIENMLKNYLLSEPGTNESKKDMSVYHRELEMETEIINKLSDEKSKHIAETQNNMQSLTNIVLVEFENHLEKYKRIIETLTADKTDMSNLIIQKESEFIDKCNAMKELTSTMNELQIKNQEFEKENISKDLLLGQLSTEKHTFNELTIMTNNKLSECQNNLASEIEKSAKYKQELEECYIIISNNSQEMKIFNDEKDKFRTLLQEIDLTNDKFSECQSNLSSEKEKCAKYKQELEECYIIISNNSQDMKVFNDEKDKFRTLLQGIALTNDKFSECQSNLSSEIKKCAKYKQELEECYIIISNNSQDMKILNDEKDKFRTLLEGIELVVEKSQKEIQHQKNVNENLLKEIESLAQNNNDSVNKVQQELIKLSSELEISKNELLDSYSLIDNYKMQLEILSKDKESHEILSDNTHNILKNQPIEYVKVKKEGCDDENVILMQQFHLSKGNFNLKNIKVETPLLSSQEIKKEYSTDEFRKTLKIFKDEALFYKEELRAKENQIIILNKDVLDKIDEIENYKLKLQSQDVELHSKNCELVTYCQELQDLKVIVMSQKSDLHTCKDDLLVKSQQLECLLKEKNDVHNFIDSIDLNHIKSKINHYDTENDNYEDILKNVDPLNTEYLHSQSERIDQSLFQKITPKENTSKIMSKLKELHNSTEMISKSCAQNILQKDETIETLSKECDNLKRENCNLQNEMTTVLLETQSLLETQLNTLNAELLACQHEIKNETIENQKKDLAKINDIREKIQHSQMIERISIDNVDFKDKLKLIAVKLNVANQNEKWILVLLSSKIEQIFGFKEQGTNKPCEISKRVQQKSSLPDSTVAIPEDLQVNLKEALFKTLRKMKDINNANFYQHIESDILNVNMSSCNPTDVSGGLATINNVIEHIGSMVTTLVEENKTLEKKLAASEQSNGDLMDSCRILREKYDKMKQISCSVDESAIKLNDSCRKAVSENLALKDKIETITKVSKDQNLRLQSENELIKTAYEKLMAEHRDTQTKLVENRDTEHLMLDMRNEYEDKLARMKQKMKQLYQDQIAVYAEKQKEELAGHEALCKKYTEKIKSYEAHVNQLSSELWKVGEKLLMEKNEKDWLRQQLRERSSSRQSLNSISSTFSLPQTRSLQNPEESKKKPSQTLPREAEKKQPAMDYKNRHSFKVPLSTKVESGGLHMSDEEGEVFDNTYLLDMKAGMCTPRPSTASALLPDRLSELQWRNSLCLPHLKSSYPAETQFQQRFKEDDIRHGLPGNLDDSIIAEKPRHKKEVGQTSYKKPGPPTPSKNGGRSSLQGNEREPLKEYNDNNPKKATTPSRIKSLFMGNNSRSSSRDENSIGTPKSRRLSIFRKPR